MNGKEAEAVNYKLPLSYAHFFVLAPPIYCLPCDYSTLVHGYLAPCKHSRYLSQCDRRKMRDARASCPLHLCFSLQHLSDLLFVHRLSFRVEAELEFRPTHPEDLEAVDLRDELGWSVGHQLWVGLNQNETKRAYLHENVWKACSEISAINIELLRPWYVHVLASRTVNLYARCRQLLGDPNGQHTLSLTEHSRAVAEGAQHVFLLHHR